MNALSIKKKIKKGEGKSRGAHLDGLQQLQRLVERGVGGPVGLGRQADPRAVAATQVIRGPESRRARERQPHEQSAIPKGGGGMMQPQVLFLILKKIKKRRRERER